MSSFNVFSTIEKLTRALNCTEKAIKMLNKNKSRDKNRLLTYAKATSDELKDALVHVVDEFDIFLEKDITKQAFKAIEAKERREDREVSDTLKLK